MIAGRERRPLLERSLLTQACAGCGSEFQPSPQLPAWPLSEHALSERRTGLKTLTLQLGDSRKFGSSTSPIAAIMTGVLAKVALFVTAAGLLVGMTTMNGRVQPLDTRPVVYQPQYSVQRSDLLVVLPTSLDR